MTIIAATIPTTIQIKFPDRREGGVDVNVRAEGVDDWLEGRFPPVATAVRLKLPALNPVVVQL